MRVLFGDFDCSGANSTTQVDNDALRGQSEPIETCGVKYQVPLRNTRPLWRDAEMGSLPVRFFGEGILQRTLTDGIGRVNCARTFHRGHEALQAESILGLFKPFEHRLIGLECSLKK